MPAYYNENDPFAAAWLRNLIKAGLIANGDVDDRSIRDVRPDDLRSYSQCHFFAGIGGWSFAFRLAGLDDDFPAWSGSCPCQSFSAAGKGKGFEDERHLWPEWSRIVRERRPSIVFGEQVSRAINHGWLDLVASDLEAEDYAIAAAVYPVCAVDAPHERERLYFVADAGGAKLWQQSRRGGGTHGQGAALAREHGATQSLADYDRTGSQIPQREAVRGTGRREERRAASECGELLADADSYNRQRRPSALQMGRIGGEGETEDYGYARGTEWPPEPSMGRVAHGIPNRVGALRGFGNAIVPKAAAEFVAAALECAP